MNKIIKVCKVHGDLIIDQVKIEHERLRCIACHAKNAKTYRERNREKLRAYSRKYYNENKK